MLSKQLQKRDRKTKHDDAQLNILGYLIFESTPERQQIFVDKEPILHT